MSISVFLKYFVDEFGDPTDSGYIASETLEGKFSNSATTDSQLLAYFIIDDSDISLKLFEYGSQVVKGSISRITCYTSIKHNGVKLDGYLVANNNQDRFVFNYEGKKRMENAEKGIEELKKISSINGFLIGGASQNSKNFIDIIKKTIN